MSYSRAFISCYQYGQPIRLDRIMKRDKSLIWHGDITYSDGQVGLQTYPVNGDYCDSMLWYPNAAGASGTVGAATTIYGVAGQLPTGALGGIVGGTNYPPSSTFSARAQVGGIKGAAVAVVTTNGSGVVTAISLLTGGQGYTNGAGAVVTLYDQPWDSGYTLRRLTQLFNIPEWYNYFSQRKNYGHESIWFWDDHDQGANNCDWSTAFSAPGATTPKLILDMHRVVGPALVAALAINNYADNNTLDGTGGDVPSGLAGVVGTNGLVASGADWRQYYFYRDCDADGKVVRGTVGQSVCTPDATAGPAVVREVYIDCVSYKSPVGNTDNAAKTMLGLQQKAWLKARWLEAKALGLQVWNFSDKDLFNLDNSDGWVSYTTERDEILAYFHNNGCAGVWITGDRHCAHAAITTVVSPASVGSAYDHISVCGTPFGSIMGQVSPASVTDTGNTAYPEMLWQHLGRDQCVYARIVWNSVLKQTEIQVLDNCDDTEQFFCAVSAGSRVPTPQQVRSFRSV